MPATTRNRNPANSHLSKGISLKLGIKSIERPTCCTLKLSLRQRSDVFEQLPAMTNQDDLRPLLPGNWLANQTSQTTIHPELLLIFAGFITLAEHLLSTRHEGQALRVFQQAARFPCPVVLDVTARTSVVVTLCMSPCFRRIITSLPSVCLAPLAEPHALLLGISKNLHRLFCYTDFSPKFWVSSQMAAYPEHPPDYSQTPAQ